MNLLDRTRLLAHILRWRLTWNRRDTRYLPPEKLPEKFTSARAAVDAIPDGACVVSSGFAGNARCSIFFWALRERFPDSPGVLFTLALQSWLDGQRDETRELLAYAERTGMRDARIVELERAVTRATEGPISGSRF